MLLNNAGAAILRVQGGSLVGDGDAVLTAADASTNAGAIVLESLDGVHNGYFKALGTFTNAAGGRIQVNLPPGDAGQGSITADWLANDGGAVADTTALPTLPPLQAAVDQAQAANNSGGTVDPATALLALLGQTPGTNDGVIVVGGVSGVGGSNAAPPNGDGNGGPDGSGGLIGVLDNFGDVVIGSVEAPLATAGAILDGATDGVWSQVAVPVVVSAWQGARPYVEQYGLPLVGAAGQFVQDHVQPVVQQVVVPFIEAAAGRVAALPQNVVEIGSILHDGVASVLAASSPWWAPVLGQQSYQASLWSAFAHGLQQAQAQGNGLEYAVNAGLNAATLGLYGDAEAFLPAYEQAQATGGLAPLAAWAGGATADVLMNPLAAEALGAAGSIAGTVAAGEWPLGEAGSAARLAGVTTAWSAEAGIEAGLGETAAGLQAATEAGSEANLSEAVQSAEATAETTAAGGDAADAAPLAEAEVQAAEAEAAARQALGTDSAVDAAAAEVEQARQACQEGSLGGCFAAGTPLLTPDGDRLIERLRKGDRVLSRPESLPNAPMEAKEVEEVFRRFAAVLDLRVGGRTIRTTVEHPFWVRGRGWLPASELAGGDGLLGHDGKWTTVEDIRETGETITVYNLRIADYHTYFVGGLDWGFSVWAHNNYADQIGTPAENQVIAELEQGNGPPGLTEPFEVVGSIANGRGNGLDIILQTESGKYVFVEVKAAGRYVSDGSNFNAYQRSFDTGQAYVQAQMQQIVESYRKGTGQYINLKTGGDYLTGEQAAQIDAAIRAQGGYGNVDVYVARVNNVASQQIPGTNIWELIGNDPIRWVQW